MWYFRIANPVVRKGEKGGFKWVFRRLNMTIETLSGNFKASFTADEHPFGYLAASKDDTNIHGFALTMYEIGKLLTTDQGFVDDVQKAIAKYEKRLEKAGAAASEKEDEDIAMKEVQAVQEIIEMPKKERRKYERDVNGRFKASVKDL